MKINILGWFGQNNVGDEAFKLVFKDFFIDNDLNFITPPQICDESDIVILGGGAVASPFYLKMLPKDVKKYAIGIDLAYESEANLLKKENFSSIYVRTKSDVETLNKAEVSCPVFAIPDLAFHIKPTGKDVIGKYKKYPNKKTVGVLVTDYINPAINRPYDVVTVRSQSFITNLSKELDSLWEQGYEIILIPCSTGGYADDRRINLDLEAFMNYRPTNIFDTIDPQDMIDLIAQCDVTICQRFHAHIFSVIAGTPFVSIQLTRKVELFLEENNFVDWIGGFYVNRKTFDFSNVSKLINSFSSDDKFRLTKVANSNNEELQLIKQKVLSELSL